MNEMSEREIEEYIDKVSLLVAWKVSLVAGLLSGKGFEVKMNFMEGDQIKNFFPTIIPGGEKIVICVPIHKEELNFQLPKKKFSPEDFNKVISAILN